MLETNLAADERGRSKSFQPTARQLLRALEAMANVGFCTLSFADGRVQCSDGVHMIAGTLDRIGQPIDLSFIEARTHPDDRPELIESFHLLMRDMLPRNRTLRLIREDGTVRNLEMRFERLVDDQLHPTGWIICVIDQSESESLRRSLAITRHRLRATLRQLDTDVVWFGSLDGLLVEPTVISDQLAVSPAALLGTNGWLRLIHPDDRAAALAAQETGKPNITEFRVAVGPNQYLPMRTVRSAVVDETGAMLEWLGLSSIVRTNRASPLLEAEGGEQLLTGPLLRAARNLLDWTIPVLAERSGISASTIMRIEESAAPVGEVARRRTVDQLSAALIAGGVVFHRTMTGKLAISL